MFIINITQGFGGANAVETLSFSAFNILAFILSVIAGYIVLYILFGMGIQKLAENQNIDSRFAFVPFARYILLGKIIGETRFFGKKIKNIGKIVAWVVLGTFVVSLASDLLGYYHLLHDVFNGETVFLDINFVMATMNWVGPTYSTYGVTYKVFAYALSWFALLCNIAYIGITVMWTFRLFRKYSMRNYILFSLFSTILCAMTLGSELGFLFTFVLNLSGIFVFVVRNNKPINIEEFMKKRFSNYYGMPHGFNPFANDNEKTNPFTDSPFDDFNKKDENDSPFDDFK